jgi:hypothetical protein
VNRTLALVAIPVVSILMSVSIAQAQRGTGDWMTSGYDAQRSSWVRADPKISVVSMSKPGFALDWKVKFNNTARQLNTLTPPALLDFYIGYRGFRSFGFFGASADRIITVDIDIARIEWEKSLSTATSAPAGTPLCPGGMTAAVTRPTNFDYPSAFLGRGAGRGTPAKSGVGEPHQGAVTLAARAAARPAPPPKPVSRAAAAAAAAASPFSPRIQWILGLTGDGKLHSLYVSNGEQPSPAVQFLPPGANAHGLISVNNVVYVATSNSCGGVDNGVWALDLATKKVDHWKAPGKGVAGTAGPAATPDGTFYATSGSQLVSLAPRTLAQQATYNTGGAEFVSSPVIFEFKGKELVAAATNDGKLHVLDTKSIGGGALAKSAAFSTPNYAMGALASWEDSDGTRWILAPAAGNVATSAGFTATNGSVTNGAIVAWKVVDKAGVPTLEPGWVSRDLTSPLPPVVINGVVFALSSGEHRSNDAQTTIQRSGKAVLYALDGTTGKELWNSGNTITSFVHSGGLSAGGSRIYVAGFDGTQYAFSFPIEH